MKDRIDELIEKAVYEHKDYLEKEINKLIIKSSKSKFNFVKNKYMKKILKLSGELHLFEESIISEDVSIYVLL